MEAVQINAKAITGAVMVLLVVLLREFFPDFATDEVTEACRVLVELAVSALVIWAVPNKSHTVRIETTATVGDKPNA